MVAGPAAGRAAGADPIVIGFSGSECLPAFVVELFRGFIMLAAASRLVQVMQVSVKGLDSPTVPETGARGLMALAV